MYACTHIPSFPLSVLLRDDLETARTPAALVSTTTSSSRTTPVLLAANRPAARFRITPGLTTTRALARCPHLALLTPDPNLEQQYQSELRDFVASLAPDFEETAPGTFVLDLLTLPHALSSPHDWIECTLRRATPLRLPLHLALAPTPDLALLAVHGSRVSSSLTFTPDPEFHIQHAAFSIQTIAHLPLSHLHPGSCSPHPDSPLNLELLKLWGIEDLGSLAALPRQGLAERLGPEVTRLHDILHRKHHRLLTLHRPPQHFQVSQDLEAPLETLEPLLFLLRRGLDTLCARLASSQRAAITARLTLSFDDDTVHLRDLLLPEPTGDPATLLRLLHTHLDAVRASAPVVAWSLQLVPTLPGQAQHHLFERSLRDPNKFADTLARLEALLGPDRLGTPAPRDTHKPDSFALRAPLSGLTPSRHRPHRRQTKTSAHPSLHPEPGPLKAPSPTALPLKRYRPPLQVHVASEPRGRHHYPLALLTGPHRGRVTAAHGPFPLSGHWWNPEERWEQVEWDLQLADQTLLRLAFDPSRNPIQQWRLEGIYE